MLEGGRGGKIDERRWKEWLQVNRGSERHRVSSHEQNSGCMVLLAMLSNRQGSGRDRVAFPVSSKGEVPNGASDKIYKRIRKKGLHRRTK